MYNTKPNHRSRFRVGGWNIAGWKIGVVGFVEWLKVGKLDVNRSLNAATTQTLKKLQGSQPAKQKPRRWRIFQYIASNVDRFQVHAMLLLSG